MPPKTRVPPWTAMPFMIAPMPCSRMPKWSTRPASGSAFHIFVARSPGRNDGTPSMVVLLEPARSAEPPQSSGRIGGDALITVPEATRVAMPFASAVERRAGGSSQPSGRVRVCSRSKRAVSADGLRGPRGELVVPRRPARPCRARPPRGCARGRRSAPRRSASGSKPSTFLVAATSSAPSAEPWALPVFWAFGRGPGDDRVEHDEARLVGDRLGLADRVVQRRHVLLVRRAAVGPVDVLDVPAVGLVAGADVLGRARCRCCPRSRSGCRRRSG